MTKSKLPSGALQARRTVQIILIPRHERSLQGVSLGWDTSEKEKKKMPTNVYPQMPTSPIQLTGEPNEPKEICAAQTKKRKPLPSTCTEQNKYTWQPQFINTC